MTVLRHRPATAIRMCEMCGQPLRAQRGGVFLTSIKAALWDAIVTSGDYGISVAELQRLDVWHDRPRVKAVTVRMHIIQLNDALANTPWRIVSLDRRYVLMQRPKVCEAAA